MNKFTKYVKVHIAANGNENLIARGVDLFKEVFQAGSNLNARGYWKQYEEETVIAIHWTNDDETLARRVIDTCKLWQEIANQEAVSIEVYSQDTGWFALVVYADDWQEAFEELLPVFDRAEYLAAWFDKRG
jgi:hypothetical protein